MRYQPNFVLLPGASHDPQMDMILRSWITGVVMETGGISEESYFALPDKMKQYWMPIAEKV